MDRGSLRVCGGLLGLAEASAAAERPRQHRLLGRLLRHPGDAVLGLRRPLTSGQRHRDRGCHGSSQIRTSRKLRSQFDGLGWTQRGEGEKSEDDAAFQLNSTSFEVPIPKALNM